MRAKVCLFHSSLFTTAHCRMSKHVHAWTTHMLHAICWLQIFKWYSKLKQYSLMDTHKCQCDAYKHSTHTVHTNRVHSHLTTEHSGSFLLKPHSCSAYSACLVWQTMHGITLYCRRILLFVLKCQSQSLRDTLCAWCDTYVFACYSQLTSILLLIPSECHFLQWLLVVCQDILHKHSIT